MNDLSQFHFLRPLWLLLLLGLPLIGLLWRRVHAQAGAWRQVVDARLLPHLLETGLAGKPRVALWLAAVLWLLATCALAGPAWEREAAPLYRNQAARVLALELAPSMLAEDVKPTRLARARFKLNDILTRSRDLQTALIGYAGDAFVAAPLTDDVDTVRNLIDALDPSVMPVTGNATARAIERGVELIHQAGVERGQIILLADGVSTDAVAAARAAWAHGISVSVLGVGTAAGAPVALPQGGFLQDARGDILIPRLDADALRAVAEAGGGRYATLRADDSDLTELLPLLQGARGATATGDGTMQTARWIDRGPWLLLLLLPLALLGFRRGWTMLLALALFAPHAPVQAASLSDLFLRADQQAARALADGDAKRALAADPSPPWRAGAAYRDGDYAAAAKDYAAQPGAVAAYNEGNALTKLGQYDKALQAYARALAQDPQLADATANRTAVEQWLKQQPPPPQDGKQGSQSDKSTDSADQDPQGQSGQSQSQDGSQGQDGAPQPQSGADREQGEQSKSDRSDGSGSDTDHRKEADSESGNASAQSDEERAAEEHNAKSGQDAEAQAGDKAATEEQQQALSRQIDEALANPDQAAKDSAEQGQAGAQDEATSEQRQAQEQWLQRIPDDPGGLLRRKFQLEYQQRQGGRR